MPLEPDSKMNELLRTFARKRRDDAGGPSGLHRATRRLLQAEAAKLRPPPDSGRRMGWTWLLARWPRVAISAGLFAVLALVVWNILPGRESSPSQMMLAQKERAINEPAPLRAPAAASADTLGLRTEASRGRVDREKDKAAPRRLNEDRFGQDIPRRGLAPDEGQTLKQEIAAQPQDPLPKPAVLLSRQDAPRPTPAKTIAPAAPAPPAPVPRLRMAAAPPAPSAAATAAPADFFAETQAGTTWHYRFKRQSGLEDLGAGERKLAPVAPLSTFEIQQTAGGVRVIDGDGSVYSGGLVPAEAESKTRLGEFDSGDKRLQAETQERLKRGNTESAQGSVALSWNGRVGTNLAFRVTGTNRTTGQFITFEGAIMDNAGAARARELFATKPSGAPARGPSPAPPAVQPPALGPVGGAAPPGNAQESRRLAGRLRIGASNEITIIAVPDTK